MSHIPSLYHPNGLPGDPTLVAVIYFDTDKVELTSSAKDMLASVIRGALDPLNSNRITMYFVGAADRRAGAPYNYNLGLRRAEAVADYVGRSLKRFKNYAGIPATSVGESKAHQSKPSRQEMSSDRKVEVRMERVGIKRIPIAARSLDIPKRNRLVERHFLKVNATNEAKGGYWGKDEVDWVRVVEMIRNRNADADEAFEYKYGSEKIADRRSQLIPGDFVVTRVKMNLHTSHTFSGTMDFIFASASIKYEWGPSPSLFVNIETSWSDDSFGKETSGKSEGMSPRLFADQLTIYNPPEP